VSHSSQADRPGTERRRKEGDPHLSSFFVLLCTLDSMQLFHFFICSLARCLSPPLEHQLQEGTTILPSIPRVQLRAWYRNGAQQTFVDRINERYSIK